jgi:hypothetical protein
MPDGRFLMIRPEATTVRPLVLVDGWFTELRAKLKR